MANCVMLVFCSVGWQIVLCCVTLLSFVLRQSQSVLSLEISIIRNLMILILIKLYYSLKKSIIVVITNPCENEMCIILLNVHL